MPDSVLKTLSLERRARQWEETLQDDLNPYHPTLVAEMNQQVAGFANYGWEREGDREYEGELFAIYVLKKVQGMGIGRALVQSVASGLLALEFSSMLVWVLSNNPYKSFMTD